ncbi:hypothetical protein THAOC_26904 [Thalassiosira oceanica]|uniref:Uncharacterized protein n=1 Tax=Thalassiosira oceanica TaxID=159749 RepID=K0RK89_THAOC|nr:hypothetical protein THAOC_26904 [Thalassiosira oceanica]|eukprot:EJK53620.1 hypothetical protein THAOC_26904 [Thalassiosira oceanica]
MGPGRKAAAVAEMITGMARQMDRMMRAARDGLRFTLARALRKRVPAFGVGPERTQGEGRATCVARTVRSRSLSHKERAATLPRRTDKRRTPRSRQHGPARTGKQGTGCAWNRDNPVHGERRIARRSPVVGPGVTTWVSQRLHSGREIAEGALRGKPPHREDGDTSADNINRDTPRSAGWLARSTVNGNVGRAV